MLKTVCLFVFAGAAALPAVAQQSCNILPITTTKTGRVGVFNNTTLQCAGWRFSYYSQGFSAVSIELDGAPDNNGSPGTWAAIAATTPCTVAGTNPATNTASGTALFSNCYFPWVSINVTLATGTGSITAGANGLNTAASSNGGTAGAGGSFLSGTTDPGVPAVPAIVQKTSAQASSVGAALSLAFTGTVTVGNDLIVQSICQNSTITTVTDTQGTSYSSLSITGNMAVFKGIAGGSGADTVTVNAAGACSFMAISLQEISGSNHTLDGTINVVTTTGGPPGVTTTLMSDLLVLGSTFKFSCSAVFTATPPTVLDTSSSGNLSIAAGHMPTSAPGAYTPSLTNNAAGCTQWSYTFALQPIPVLSPGNNGDFYINLTTGVLWGPKSGGSWSNAGWHWVAN